MPRQSLVISRNLAGRAVVELLRSHFRLTPAQVKQLMRHDAIRLGGQVCRDLTRRVRAGQRLQLTGEPMPRTPPPERKQGRRKSSGAIRIVYADDQVVVVDKPAGLTTVRHASETARFGQRARRFLPATLIDVLADQLAAQHGKQGRLRAVHRLDKDTSGLVAVARSADAERQLGVQFRAHQVERTYLALVRGQARSEMITSVLVDDRGDGRRGSTRKGSGQKAVTHVKVMKELGDFSLVECRLETGRTHQVRIHLGEAGTPLCGERIYDRPVHGQPVPDASGATRPMLHAATLGFTHPATGKRMSFESELPADMRDMIEPLGGTP